MRLLGFAGFALLLAVVAFSTSGGAARRGITPAGFAALEALCSARAEGGGRLSRAEAEALLGGPPGDYTGGAYRRGAQLGYFRRPELIHIDGPRHLWLGEGAAIELVFWRDDAEVFEATLFGVVSLPATTAGRVRRWLGW